MLRAVRHSTTHSTHKKGRGQTQMKNETKNPLTEYNWTVWVICPRAFKQPTLAHALIKTVAPCLCSSTLRSHRQHYIAYIYISHRRMITRSLCICIRKEKLDQQRDNSYTTKRYIRNSGHINIIYIHFFFLKKEANV